ncbi:hypothetical protein JCM10212_004240 [Sporobolomyces blumeae]
MRDSPPPPPPPPPPKPVLVPFILTLVLFSLVAVYPSTRSFRRRLARRVHRLVARLVPRLPRALESIILARDDDEQRNLSLAISNLSHYSSNQHRLLSTKHFVFHRQPKRHREIGTELGWTDFLDRVDDAIEENQLVLDDLAAIGLDHAKRRGIPLSNSTRRRGFRNFGTFKPSSSDQGRVIETLKHFVRDWSEQGKPERDCLFPPILSALEAEFPFPRPFQEPRTTTSDDEGSSQRGTDQAQDEENAPGPRSSEGTSRGKVLVPGCGLARLAYEIALLGFETTANDFSSYMSLAQRFVLSPTHTHTRDQHVVSPYVHSFSHQRTRDHLTRQVRFPDVVPSLSSLSISTADEDDDEVERKRRVGVDDEGTRGRQRDAGRLKLRPGDFTTEFEPERGTYDAVVTLFFIDTASNLLVYFDTIWHLLRPGGVWINEGPLLYFGKVSMELPLEDVVKAAELIGFVFEGRKTLREVKYTGDELGMYTFAYDAEFWVARKPAL